ncbi:sorting nexin-29-related [Anaeramoeba ignava]|uniref:Sorting nexin-29-related n=1 Tax=Anaeramoeba ignava TaxID=1746090 RepID=A0A9Q0LPW8_ANAIG|nr:sorting nexin-29-related [Anaeramoeba ignava]
MKKTKQKKQKEKEKKQEIYKNISYLVDISLHKIRVSIPSHVQVTTRTRKYYAFELKISNGTEEWTLFRRYSQFFELNKELKINYPYHDFALPPKKFIGNKKANFVSQRRELLQEFIQNIIATPGLEKDATLSLFLSPFYLPPYQSLKNPTFKGFIYKMAKRNRFNWKKRWTIIQYDQLYLYNSENDILPTKQVSLHQVSIKWKEGNKSFKLNFSTNFLNDENLEKKNKVLSLRTNTKEETVSFLQILKSTMKKSKKRNTLSIRITSPIISETNQNENIISDSEEKEL